MNANETQSASTRLFARLAIPLAAVLICAAGAIAADNPPGFVDARLFTDLVGDDEIQVEITIGPTLLRMMGAGIGVTDPDLAAAIEGLRGIRVLVIDLSAKSARGGVEQLVKDTVRSVEGSGWERLAVVRDESSLVNVLIKGDEEDRVRGLLVLVLEKESNELIFVNLHGLVDLAKLQSLSEAMELPALDHVPPPEQD